MAYVPGDTSADDSSDVLDRLGLRVRGSLVYEYPVRCAFVADGLRWLYARGNRAIYAQIASYICCDSLSNVPLPKGTRTAGALTYTPVLGKRVSKTSLSAGRLEAELFLRSFVATQAK